MTIETKCLVLTGVIVIVIVYYLTVLFAFLYEKDDSQFHYGEQRYNTKKDFFMDLIPFYMWVEPIVIGFNNLK